MITINKVKDEFGWLSCMSPYPVEYERTRYRTCEALFQCLRFPNNPEVQNEILEQKSPIAAKMKARKYKSLLNRGAKWDESNDDIPLMYNCLKLKLFQHPDLQTKLIQTGEDLIVEDCTSHDRESARFWGMVKKEDNWIGSNVLGLLWMQIRDELKTAENIEEYLKDEKFSCSKILIEK
ncbi:MAG: NADAR family protein [Syntrophothermus sp.]